MEIVDAWGPAMLRLARQFTPSRAVAEEVVQETWLAVLDGLDRFEGRSSLRTWVMRILVNRAKTRGARERRTVPFAALAADEAAGGFEAVAADRFLVRRPRPLAPPLGRAAAPLGDAAAGRAGVGRDARGDPRRDRAPAGRPSARSSCCGTSRGGTGRR